MLPGQRDPDGGGKKADSSLRQYKCVEGSFLFQAQQPQAVGTCRFEANTRSPGSRKRKTQHGAARLPVRALSVDGEKYKWYLCLEAVLLQPVRIGSSSEPAVRCKNQSQNRRLSYRFGNETS